MLKRFIFRVFFENELREQHLFLQEQWSLALTEAEQKYFEGKARVIEGLLDKYGSRE
jgi:hypothetical protein